MRIFVFVFLMLISGCGGGGSSGGESPPPTPTPKKVIVYVPGGGWATVAKPSEVPPDIATLPGLAHAKGWEYVQLDYPVGECCLAEPIVSKLTRDFERLRGNYQTVAVIASSAGTTPTMTILQSRPELIDAYVGLCGIYDLTTTPDEFNNLYGRRYTLTPVEDSPAYHPRPGKPYRLWHSTGDDIVPWEQSVGFSDTNTELVVDPDLKHCLGIWNRSSSEIMEWIEANHA